MTDAFLLRCSISLAIGLLCGYAFSNVLIIAVIVAFTLIAAVSLLVDMEYRRGRQEAFESIDKIIAEHLTPPHTDGKV